MFSTSATLLKGCRFFKGNSSSGGHGYDGANKVIDIGSGKCKGKSVDGE
jgi:hypothetical protein